MGFMCMIFQQGPSIASNLKSGVSQMPLSTTPLGLIKASFVITLLKPRSPDRRINIALWTMFVINGLFTITAPFVCAFQCSPLSKFWDKSRPGTCIDSAKYTYGIISVVLIMDVAVVIMLTWILRNLQLLFLRKLMYIAFMSFGLAVTGIGGYRLYVFVQLFTKKMNNPDASYGMRRGLSNVEVSLASIGACGGTVRWLLSRCIPFPRDDATPRLSKNGASRSSGMNEAGSRQSTNHSANRGWRSWGRRAANSTLVSQETPPPVVWKRVETRKRGSIDRNRREAAAHTGSDGVGSRVPPEPEEAQCIEDRTASSSKGAARRDVVRDFRPSPIQD